MKLFALTFGDENCASSAYRIFQYRDRFDAAGIEFEWAEAKEFSEYDRLAGADVVILQKTLVSRPRFRAIREASARLIYDADDRIWMRPGRPYGFFTAARIRSRLGAIARGCDEVVCANEVIAGDLRKAGARRTEMLPMSVDESAWAPPRGGRAGPVTIGWSGNPKNLPFLEALAPALRSVGKRFPEARFCVHCGERPRLEGLAFEHLPFVPGEEPDAVGRFDIGLLPLPDDPFVRGKSPIKALQYMACGVAIAGEAPGATGEIVEDGVNGLVVNADRPWEEVLGRLVEDGDLRRRLGETGCEVFRERFAKSRVGDRLVEIVGGKGQ